MPINSKEKGARGDYGEMCVEKMGLIKSVELHNIVVKQAMQLIV
nr:MAG TPA: hypothetical protein [Caudoviricetes sp.]